ncbi:MAG: hypothetical protein L0Z68_10245 [Gammaproteobacteria bacterium]|nr:hypothetical protein [Gammaproteobacteria bacterium]
MKTLITCLAANLLAMPAALAESASGMSPASWSWSSWSETLTLWGHIEIDFYGGLTRVHSGIRYKSPIEYEQLAA